MRIHHLSRICLSGALISMMTSAYAVGDGAYLGFGLGQTSVNASSALVMGVPATANKTGMGGRLFFGGQFNPHGAFEMGFTHYAPATYDVSAPSGNKPALRISAIDFSFKGMYSLPYFGVTVFGMPGLAIAHASQSGSLTSAGQTGGNSTSVRPKVGLGVSYDINQSWVVDLSMQRMFGSGMVRSSTLTALSFSYHFVDLKCGQFLC